MVKRANLKSISQKHLERAANLAFFAKAWNQLDFMVSVDKKRASVFSVFLATVNRHCQINIHWHGNGETSVSSFFCPVNDDMRIQNDKRQEIRF